MSVETELYAGLTGGLTRFVRVEELVLRGAEAAPGLLPDATALAADASLPLRDKARVETAQARFISRVLADPLCGRHLCHAMLLPRPEAAAALRALEAEGAVDLGPMRLERHGRAVHLLNGNPRYLNAEDDATIDAMEIAVDAAILDPGSDIAVLRGRPVEHPKYAGRRLFGSGINLTHLYRGLVPYLWYVRRELGFVHKFLRGVARPDMVPDDVTGIGIEKPWIAAVEGFAIGGHCQMLLTMDYVLAAEDAFMTLPARKEGIIPGAANLRLPRFTGERLARQLIQAERKLFCDSAEGRLICDAIVAPEAMDAAIADTVALLTDAGSVGALGNRRAFRAGAEPFDLFRAYAAVYVREQADCHFSPALVDNLERNWGAQKRG